MSLVPSLLLDTCAAIWLAAGQPMSDESLDVIRLAQGDGTGVHVSPIAAWEIATLVSKGRLKLSLAPEAWFAALLALPGVRLAPMPPDVLIASAALPGMPPRDPADRIVAATARAYGFAVVTRDGELLPYAAAGHLMAIRC